MNSLSTLIKALRVSFQDRYYKRTLLILFSLILNSYSTQSLYYLFYCLLLPLYQTSSKKNSLPSHALLLFTPYSWSVKCGLWEGSTGFPLGACLMWRIVGLTPDLMDQNPHFNKITKRSVGHLRLRNTAKAKNSTLKASDGLLSTKSNGQFSLFLFLVHPVI